MLLLLLLTGDGILCAGEVGSDPGMVFSASMWLAWVLSGALIAVLVLFWRYWRSMRQLLAKKERDYQEQRQLLHYVKNAAEYALMDFFHCDLAGHDLSGGQYCQRNWGRDADGRPMHPRDWVYGLDVEMFLEEWRRLLTGECTSLQFNYRRESAGVMYHYEFCAARWLDADSNQEIIIGFIRDVSLREGYRQQLLDAKSLLETVINNLPAYIYIKNADRNFRYVMCSSRTLNLSPEAMLGQNDFALLDEALARKSYEDDTQLLADGGERSSISRYSTPEHGEWVFSVYKKILRQTNGERLILSVLTDITAETIRREEMEKNNAVLTGILNHLPAWIAVKNTDNDFRYILWNHAAEKLSGISRTRAIGHNDAELPELAAFAEEFRRKDRQTLEHEIVRSHEELCDAEGNKLHLHTIRMRLHHGGHENLELVMGLDVTDEKRLKQTEYEKLLLIDAVRIPIMLFDADHKLLRVNRAAQEIAGLPEEQIYSQPCYQSFCTFPTPPEMCPVRLSLRDRQTHHWVVTLGGRDYHLTAYPILQNNELKYVLKTLLDVTESNENQRRLAAALQEAENANRAKSNFLATVSHEIRTPLNAVIGFAEVLQEAELPEAEQKEFLASIQQSGNTLLRLINDVLELSQIDSAQTEMELRATDIDGLLQEVAAIFQRDAEEKHIRIAVSSPAVIPPLLLDAIRLRQILVNIVGNAVKFTEQGGVTLRAEWDEGSGELKLDVTDSGIGIKPEEQQKIFDPFHQQDTMRDTHIYKGTGLGLSIARKLVQKMHGSITVASREGFGSTFTIRFSPVQPAPRQSDL